MRSPIEQHGCLLIVNLRGIHHCSRVFLQPPIQTPWQVTKSWSCRWPLSWRCCRWWWLLGIDLKVNGGDAEIFKDDSLSLSLKIYRHIHCSILYVFLRTIIVHISDQDLYLFNQVIFGYDLLTIVSLGLRMYVWYTFFWLLGHTKSCTCWKGSTSGCHFPADARAQWKMARLFKKFELCLKTEKSSKVQKSAMMWGLNEFNWICAPKTKGGLGYDSFSVCLLSPSSPQSN